MTPAERLRAFEDEKLGKDAPRHQGKVEMGHGSLFSRLTDDDKARHGALEALVDAETRLAQARTELAAAEAAYAEAEKACAGPAAAAAAAEPEQEDSDHGAARQPARHGRRS